LPYRTDPTPCLASGYSEYEPLGGLTNHKVWHKARLSQGFILAGWFFETQNELVEILDQLHDPDY
jgi:hypothetical protein